MALTFDRLGALDSFFLDCESDATPMHIGCVCLFEAAGSRVTLANLRAHVEAKLDSIPRYRQCLDRVPVEGRPVWVDAENFCIDDHVRAISLPSPRSNRQFDETVDWIFSQPLSRNRPLWEIWLIEDLPLGGFALVCKTHHCLADGLAGASLLSAILGASPFTDPEPPRPWNPRRRPDRFELLRGSIDTRVREASALAARAAGQAFASPATVLKAAGQVASAMQSVASAALQPPIATAFDHPAGTSRDFLWWTASLDDVKRIGRGLGGTVNDVVLAVICDAFARTHKATELFPDTTLRAFCPVGAGHDASVGNCVSGMFIDLPIGRPEPLARFQKIAAATRRGKESGEVEGSFLLADIANALTPSLLSTLDSTFGGTRMFNLVVTNVPGPQFPLYLFEEKLTRVCPLVPLFRGQGLGIAIFSYDGKLTWGLHVDAARIDAARALRDAFAASLEVLARLADVPLTSTPTIKKRPILLHPEGQRRRRQNQMTEMRNPGQAA